MDVFDAIASRHSCRAFSPRTVDRGDAERIIEAARLAPSSMNSQPWRFHVATGDVRASLDEVMRRTTVYLDEYLAHVLEEERLEAATRFLSKLGGAPMVIAVSAPHVVGEMAEVNTLLAIGAAIENLLLAATALGLATCNVTLSYWVRDELADLFGLAEDRYVVSVIAVGYPEADVESPAHDADIVTWHE